MLISYGKLNTFQQNTGNTSPSLPLSGGVPVFDNICRHPGPGTQTVAICVGRAFARSVLALPTCSVEGINSLNNGSRGFAGVNLIFIV